jgi:hypothetical protein
MTKIESEAAQRPTMPMQRVTVVCEPQIDRTPFVVIEPGETVGTVLVAPLNPRKRRNRALWYYAFVEDLERLPNGENLCR